MELVQNKKIISFPEPFKFKACIGLYLFSKGYSLCLFGLWIDLGITGKLSAPVEAWSLTIQKNHIMVFFGPKSFTWFMPWDLVRYKMDVLTCDASWSSYREEEFPHFKKLLDVGAFKDDRLMFEAPYHYIKKNGEVQSTLAAFYVSKSFFKWRIFKNSRFGRTKFTHEINVTFKNPIGENVGSIFGGVKTVRFELKNFEDPFQCLNRMNRTQRF